VIVRWRLVPRQDPGAWDPSYGEEYFEQAASDRRTGWAVTAETRDRIRSSTASRMSARSSRAAQAPAWLAAFVSKRSAETDTLRDNGAEQLLRPHALLRSSCSSASLLDTELDAGEARSNGPVRGERSAALSATGPSRTAGQSEGRHRVRRGDLQKLAALPPARMIPCRCPDIARLRRRYETPKCCRSLSRTRARCGCTKTARRPALSVGLHQRKGKTKSLGTRQRAGDPTSLRAPPLPAFESAGVRRETLTSHAAQLYLESPQHLSKKPLTQRCDKRELSEWSHFLARVAMWHRCPSRMCALYDGATSGDPNLKYVVPGKPVRTVRSRWTCELMTGVNWAARERKHRTAAAQGKPAHGHSIPKEEIRAAVMSHDVYLKLLEVAPRVHPMLRCAHRGRRKLAGGSRRGATWSGTTSTSRPGRFTGAPSTTRRVRAVVVMSDAVRDALSAQRKAHPRSARRRYPGAERSDEAVQSSSVR